MGCDGAGGKKGEKEKCKNYGLGYSGWLSQRVQLRRTCAYVMTQWSSQWSPWLMGPWHHIMQHPKYGQHDFRMAQSVELAHVQTIAEPRDVLRRIKTWMCSAMVIVAIVKCCVRPRRVGCTVAPATTAPPNARRVALWTVHPMLLRRWRCGVGCFVR